MGNFLPLLTITPRPLKAHKNASIIAHATYWLGQAYFELNEYKLALANFQEAERLPRFSGLPFASQLHYHMGYCYFNLKNYPAAIAAFEVFLQQAQSLNYERDARLRMGDSHFALKAYWPAMDQYEKVRTLAPQRAAYAIYQQAISYGFVDRLTQKISLLKELITQFPASSLVDDCQYELALSYTKQGDSFAAIAAYDVIIQQAKESPYRSKALLNKGLIQFNEGQTKTAENTLKELVRNYPNEALAQQALQTVKEIAIERKYSH